MFFLNCVATGFFLLKKDKVGLLQLQESRNTPEHWLPKTGKVPLNLLSSSIIVGQCHTKMPFESICPEPEEEKEKVEEEQDGFEEKDKVETWDTVKQLQIATTEEERFENKKIGPVDLKKQFCTREVNIALGQGAGEGEMRYIADLFSLQYCPKSISQGCSLLQRLTQGNPLHVNIFNNITPHEPPLQASSTSIPRIRILSIVDESRMFITVIKS